MPSGALARGRYRQRARTMMPSSCRSSTIVVVNRRGRSPCLGATRPSTLTTRPFSRLRRGAVVPSTLSTRRLIAPKCLSHSLCRARAKSPSEGGSNLWTCTGHPVRVRRQRRSARSPGLLEAGAALPDSSRLQWMCLLSFYVILLSLPLIPVKTPRPPR